MREAGPRVEQSGQFRRELRGEGVHFGGGPIGGLFAGAHAFQYKAPDDLMRFVEWSAGAREAFGEIGGDDPAFGRGVERAFGIEFGGLDGGNGHFKRAGKFVGGVEDGHLVFLHVAVVSHRETLHGDH